MIKASPQASARENPSSFFSRTLSGPAALLFAVVVLILASSAGCDYLLTQREKSIALAKRAESARRDEIFIQLATLQKQIEIDLLDIRQFHYSSEKRDLNSESNGFVAAMVFAKKFSKDITAAKQAAAAFDSADLFEAFSDVEARFQKFYDIRTEIAKVSAGQETDAGEALITGLDRIGDEMRRRLEAMGPALATAKHRSDEKMGAFDARIDKIRGLMATVGLANVFSVAGASLIGLGAMRRFVALPVKRVTAAIKGLTRGDANCELDEARRCDEIGGLALSFMELRRTIVEAEAASAIRREQEAFERERQASAAEKTRMEQCRNEALRAMTGRVERETKGAAANVLELMQQMTGFTSDLSHTADGLSDTGDSVSTAAGEALRTMESAATLTQELAASIGKIVQQVQAAQEISESAVGASRKASDTIKELSQVVTEINEVTGLIAHITRQTGLLALNAGVEAARAGSEGQGFAVIAREVRSLADQTSAATVRIGGLIAQIQERTRGAVGAVDNIAKAIDRVSASTGEMTQAIKAQAQTTGAIAADVAEATSTLTDVTRQIRHVAQETENARTMAQNIDAVSFDLKDRLHKMQSKLVNVVRTSSGEADRQADARPARGIERQAA